MKSSSAKVLFIARRFPPSVGGMERFAHDLSTSLSQKITLSKITWGGSNKWLPLVFILFFFRASWILLTDKQIKIIHIQDGVQAPIGWLLSKIYRKPFLIVAHGLDVTYEKLYYQKFVLPFVRRADIVISISTATQVEVLKRGVDNNKARVITIGTTDDYGNPRPNKEKLSTSINKNLKDRLLLLTTGRLVKRKGVAWFVENVLPELTETKPEILYLVAGTGSEKENIQAAIDKKNLANHVVMLGRVDDDVRALLYQSCDVFVMPNIVVRGDMEGFGIVAHEAASAGLPVVASNLEGITDALRNDKNGILVATKDNMAFKDEILKLLNNEKARRSFGKKAREYTLKEYGWENIAEQYMQVYESMVK